MSHELPASSPQAIFWESITREGRNTRRDNARHPLGACTRVCSLHFCWRYNANLSTLLASSNEGPVRRMNIERAQALHAYHGTRIYRVEYRGFPGTRSAEMVVDVKYQSPGMKEFTIQSATGSKMIIEKVFKSFWRRRRRHRLPRFKDALL